MAEEDIVDSIDGLKSVAEQILEQLKKPAGGTPKEKQANTDKQLERSKDKLRLQVDRTADAFINLGKEFTSIISAGAQLANTLGVTVTQGIRQEFLNRNAIVSQIFTTDKDRIVSAEQLTAAQQTLATTFIGAAEGMQASATGATAFGQSLKGGFKSDFKLTADSMRALITAGVSTEAGFENLRKSSGRASLSNDQLATLVNKNSLSFMLYGPRFAKAAVQAEKLGINLAQVQSAQESMVTNLDGTLDTLNQVNQLGAQIDFGTLMRINEFEGPEATLKYLQSTIPPSLFQSASTRALLKGFGISTEDLMKRQGSVQDEAAKTIENALTELKEPIGALASFISNLYQRINAVYQTYGPVISGTIGFGVALLKLVGTVGATTAAMLLFKSGMASMGGIRGIVQSGVGKEALKGLLTTGTSAIAARGASVLGQLGSVAKFGAGVLGKVALPALAAKSAFDAFGGFTADANASVGEKFKNAGSSVLSGLTFGMLGKSASEIRAGAAVRAQALPPDTRGVGLPSKVTDPTTVAQNTELLRKIDELVRVLRDTKTIINVDNKIQQVPRTALAGVTIRNDRV